MSSLIKFKYFTAGCITGTFIQIYMLSLAEKRLQFRKNELNSLKLFYNNQIENVKPESVNKRENDLVLSFIYHTYLEYFVGMGFILFKFLNKENKNEIIQNLINDNILLKRAELSKSEE